MTYCTHAWPKTREMGSFLVGRVTRVTRLGCQKRRVYVSKMAITQLFLNEFGWNKVHFVENLVGFKINTHLNRGDSSSCLGTKIPLYVFFWHNLLYLWYKKTYLRQVLDCLVLGMTWVVWLKKQKHITNYYLQHQQQTRNCMPPHL